QDRSRQSYTRACIIKVARQAKQVIVLSHDPTFLRMLEEAAAQIETKSIQVNAMGGKMIVTPCDLEAETRTEFLRDVGTLQAYRNDSVGDRHGVARSIRPYLEAWLRNVFPGRLPKDKWLGDFI